MHWCEPLMILVFDPPLLHLLPYDLLQGCDLLTILLKYESVDLFRYLVLNFKCDQGCRFVVIISLLHKGRGGWVGTFGFRILDVVNNHDAEGEGVKDVQELVLWKVIVGREVQLSDELILHQTVPTKGFVEAKGGFKLSQEASKLIETDEGCSIGVKLGPDFSKMLSQAIIK